MKTFISSAALVAFAVSSAHAHVTLEYPVAAAGSNYKAFKVGHGCGETWPVRQVCEQGVADWTPKLELLHAGGGGAAGHAH